MGMMVFAVIGMFVLVWFVSFIMKANQAANQRPAPRPNPSQNRDRQDDRRPAPEKTTNSDLERFMAEIDKLRNRGDAQPPRPPAQNPPRKIQPAPSRTAEGNPKPRVDKKPPQPRKPVVSPPPLPSKAAEVPVLRPIAPPAPTPPPATSVGTSHTLAGFKQAKAAKISSASESTDTPVLKSLQSILKSQQGPGLAFALSEILGEPRCRKKL